jgi:5'-3' exonuclease
MRNQRILLIDGWNVLIAQNAVSHIEDGNSQPIGMYLTSLNMIRTFVDKFKPTKVFFVLDGPDAGERRRQLYPNYKGKRGIKERESKVQIMEGEDNIAYGIEGAFQNQLIKIYEFLQLLPVTVCMVPYCEADDVITYLALQNKDDFENIIISNDKDYLQLIQEGISVYRWKAKKYYGKREFLEEMKILPNNYIFKKILLGDTSDLVKGIKGMGEKTFKVLHEGLAANDYGNDLNSFIDHLRSLDLSTFGTRERNSIIKILSDENITAMELSYKLMRLSEECMLPQQIEILKIQINEQLGKRLAGMDARIKMNRTSFGKLYNGFNEDKWIHPFVFLRPGIEVKC